MPTPLLFDNTYLDYFFGPEHPFSPDRQRMLCSLLEALPIDASFTAPPPATREEVCTVHDEAFVEAVERCSTGDLPATVRDFGLNTADVPTFDGMDAAARALCGGALHGARLIANGTAGRVLQLGGGLHHAHPRRASGFCVYNDLSIAIQALRSEGMRVAYIDIDVHHGDGVQAVHATDPDVLTLSLHESGRYLFPGTGHIHEMGRGAGEGSALNIPLEPFTEDESYLETFERVVPFAIERYAPDVLVVQCGADAHFSDPLADLLLTTHAYDTVFQRLIALSESHTEGRALFTLGGGYQPDATVRIWALLAHRLLDAPLPTDLPTSWLDRWSHKAEGTLTPTLHDDERSFQVERRDAVETQNRQVSKRALERIAPMWY
ncbi:MAG: acetoin utilization protein AcuC [Longimonas sp.]|uniref:acetoin utilization protein AcuC n=1 Tax=Longimonas sp. TaxID=2039626 RepID=UPI0033646C6B